MLLLNRTFRCPSTYRQLLLSPWSLQFKINYKQLQTPLLLNCCEQKFTLRTTYFLPNDSLLTRQQILNVCERSFLTFRAPTAPLVPTAHSRVPVELRIRDIPAAWISSDFRNASLIVQTVVSYSVQFVLFYLTAAITRSHSVFRNTSCSKLSIRQGRLT